MEYLGFEAFAEVAPSYTIVAVARTFSFFEKIGSTLRQTDELGPSVRASVMVRIDLDGVGVGVGS